MKIYKNTGSLMNEVRHFDRMNSVQLSLRQPCRGNRNLFIIAHSFLTRINYWEYDIIIFFKG